jgi:hypothetical protein
MVFVERMEQRHAAQTEQIVRQVITPIQEAAAGKCKISQFHSGHHIFISPQCLSSLNISFVQGKPGATILRDQK